MAVRSESRTGPDEPSTGWGQSDWLDWETESADLGGGPRATWLPGKVGHPLSQRCFAPNQAAEGTVGSFLSGKREGDK